MIKENKNPIFQQLSSGVNDNNAAERSLMMPKKDIDLKPSSNGPKSRERRKLLKSLAAGGGVVASVTLLPKKWTRPVVDSVILPAHAQATGQVLINGTFSTSSTLTLSVPLASVVGDSVLDMLIPRAQAGEVAEIFADICINVTNDNAAVQLLLDGQILLTGSGPVPATISLGPLDTFTTAADISVSVNNNRALGTVSVTQGGSTFSGTYDAPETGGSCNLGGGQN